MHDEQAYSKMIEDYCRQILKRRAVVQMRLMPQLMHAGLISFKTFEAICKSLDKLAE